MAELAPAAPPMPFDPATFNPQYQHLTMYAPDGSLVYSDTEFLNSTRLYTARFGISYGAQIGSSFTLLIVLLLLTRSKKRKSAIFILNALCLFLNIWRCIFTACFLTGGFMHPYDLMSGFYSASAKDVAFSVTSNVLSFLVTTLVMVSLSLQVWVACVTTSNLQRSIIMGLTTAMALVSVGIKFTFMILSNTATVQLVNRGVDKISAYSWITQAIAVILYSCVFTWKLGYAIIQRRRLKMLQFGPMQIVFIMGCQTMTVPAILSALQFYQPILDEVPEIGALVITTLCIFLPLSAIWAGVANDSAIAYRGHDAHHHLINSKLGQDSSSTATSNSTTAFDKSRQMSCSTCSYIIRKGEKFDAPERSPAGKRGAGNRDIHIDHEYTVRHEEIPLEHV